MSAMHAAMDRLGTGMPCGLVARFAGKTIAEVEAAIEAACQRFPVLQRRLVWLELASGARFHRLAVSSTKLRIASFTDI